MIERTCALIKPDAVRNHTIGGIISMIEKDGFTILRLKQTTLTRAQAESFYQIHKNRSFFNELVTFMSSGPIVAMALEKENAVSDWRKLMGETNPEKAAEGTIRKIYGTNTGENATHGSDSIENAKQELSFFFQDL
jgi:nucleoside-diphosphate kinase